MTSVLREDSSGDIRGGLGERMLVMPVSQGLEPVSPSMARTHDLVHWYTQRILWAGSKGNLAAVSMLRKARFISQRGCGDQGVGPRMWGLWAASRLLSSIPAPPGTLQTQPLPLLQMRSLRSGHLTKLETHRSARRGRPGKPLLQLSGNQTQAVL